MPYKFRAWTKKGCSSFGIPNTFKAYIQVPIIVVEEDKLLCLIYR